MNDFQKGASFALSDAVVTLRSEFLLNEDESVQLGLARALDIVLGIMERLELPTP